MTLTRGFIRNAVTTPLDARLMDMAQIVDNSDGSPRPGLLDGDGRAIVTALATMDVAVAAADFVTTKGTADGVAIFTNDGTVNVAITAAPASNSRIDVVWVRHQDNTTGDGASTPIFGVTAGVAAASPTKPAIPTGALELATIRVYAGTTATNGGANVTTNTYQMTASRGGIVPFRTVAEINAWTNPRNGQRAVAIDTGRTALRVAGAWVFDDTGDLALTTGAGYTQTQAATCRVRGGMVSMNGRLDVASPGTTSAFTLPVGARPSATRVTQIMRGSAFETVVIGTDGLVQLLNLTLPQTDYRLASIPPFPAA